MIDTASTNKVRILTATDLHCVAALYEQLGDAVTTHRPDVLALVGDFLDCLGTVEPQMSTEKCAAFLGGLEVREIIFVRGNHEHSNWLEFQEAWKNTPRRLAKLHGEAAVIGPAVMVGFPCIFGDEFAFTCDKQLLPEDHAEWVSKLLGGYGPAMRTLWLMHEPPAPARAGIDIPNVFNRRWSELIERFSPLLTVSGHDHSTPIRTARWFHRLGSTVCVNVGQSESGPLHYTVIEAGFTKNTPCLPTTMRVTAYPGGEPLQIVGIRT